MHRFVQRLSVSELAIFLFHGVVDENTHSVRNYTRKHLECSEFADLLASLRAHGTPLSMDEVVSFTESGKAFPPRSFAITFDDGFLNNLTVAAPVLSDLGIPAIFYVTSDFIERNRQSWIDRIEWAVEPIRSGAIQLPWRDKEFSIRTRDDKRTFLDEVRAHVKIRPDLDPDDFASEIQRQLGMPETWSTEDPLDAKMTWAQVAKLNSRPLFTVAGHTHTHAILAHLTPNDLACEIDTSLAMLSDKAGISNHHYSYPEGLAHCYSEEVIEVLKARGIRCCPTAIDGTNAPGTDLFHLKRIMIN